MATIKGYKATFDAAAKVHDALSLLSMHPLDQYAPISPTTLKNRTEKELFDIAENDSSGHFASMAFRELERRSLLEIGNEIINLAAATKKVHNEVALLTSSSERMERLTTKLKTFTVWLMVFAGIQIIIAGVQTWKMLQPERPIQVVVPPPTLSAPLKPALPPH